MTNLEEDVDLVDAEPMVVLERRRNDKDETNGRKFKTKPGLKPTVKLKGCRSCCRIKFFSKNKRKSVPSEQK